MSGDGFTDEVLAPSRTTRAGADPVRDRMEVVQHDELLVDVAVYFGELLPRLEWCRVVSLAPGSAAVYPYKVRIPRRGVGQYRASEVMGWRRPLDWHRPFAGIAP